MMDILLICLLFILALLKLLPFILLYGLAFALFIKVAAILYDKKWLDIVKDLVDDIHNDK